MVDLTRRGFLTHTSLTVGAVGVGLAGGLGVRQLVAASALPGLSSASTPLLPAEPVVESMIVHIRDVSKAEVSLMVGTREVVFTDPQLVRRLVQASQRAEG
jgi:hypothetical protein